MIIRKCEKCGHLKEVDSYTVDLTKIKGKGEFKCPKCKTAISPDDETEEVYTVLEPVMKGDCLEKVILQCNKCGSQIHLKGLNLQKTSSI